MKKLLKWLRGEYKCIRCNKTWYAMSFGTGYFICPECYRGEREWINLEA